MLEELLDLVRKQPDLVFGYAGALVERYPRQIGEWYRNRIMLIAPDVSKRSQYQRLAERIGELARLGCVSDAGSASGSVLRCTRTAMRSRRNF
jgi:hypothetical protein